MSVWIPFQLFKISKQWNHCDFLSVTTLLTYLWVSGAHSVCMGSTGWQPSSFRVALFRPSYHAVGWYCLFCSFGSTHHHTFPIVVFTFVLCLFGENYWMEVMIDCHLRSAFSRHDIIFVCKTGREEGSYVWSNTGSGLHTPSSLRLESGLQLSDINIWWWHCTKV